MAAQRRERGWQRLLAHLRDVPGHLTPTVRRGHDLPTRLTFAVVRRMARTGSPWPDLPAHYGSWKTVASRFYGWRCDGILERLLAEVHRHADACGELDWLVHYVGRQRGPRPTSTPPAPAIPFGGGCEMGWHTRQMRHWGRSRGGVSTKLHLRTDGHGRLLAILATRGAP